jgi:hypothetical protein
MDFSGPSPFDLHASPNVFTLSDGGCQVVLLTYRKRHVEAR